MERSNGKLQEFDKSLREAERRLSRRDPVLRGFIKQYSRCSIRPHTRHFETLVGSIISQQLSTKVADVIQNRVKALTAPTRSLKPEHILAIPHETLRATGMSNGKVSFIKDLAAKTENGALKLSKLQSLSDEEVIEMLTQVKGIGVWTAHMFLIFSLGRLDVLPVGDLGVRKAIQIAYGFDNLPDAAQIESVAEERGWRPYCSVASWYLWRSLENKDKER